MGGKMEVKSYTETTERFVCPYCNNVYYDMEKALECIKHYELIQKIKEAEPFHWYQIQTTKYYLGDGSKRWIFPKDFKITGKYGSGNIKSCKEFTYEIMEFGTGYYDFGYYSYPITADQALFFPESKLTVKEGYEEHGLIPGNLDRFESKDDWNLVPDEILKDINEIVRIERRGLFEYLEKLEKDELIDCLVQFTEPFTKYKLHLKDSEYVPEKSDRDAWDALVTHINGDGTAPEWAEKLLSK